MSGTNGANYFALNQVAAGTTTIAAAVNGNKHKVYAFMLSLANDGTIRFVGGPDLTGNIKVDGQLQPVSMGPGGISLFEAGVNQALQIVTTQAAQGFVIYITEP